MLRNQIELGLKIIALKELLKRVAPSINHDTEVHDEEYEREYDFLPPTIRVSRCKPQCLKCCINRATEGQ